MSCFREHSPDGRELRPALSWVWAGAAPSKRHFPEKDGLGSNPGLTETQGITTSSPVRMEVCFVLFLNLMSYPQSLYCLLRFSHFIESSLNCPGHIAAPLFPHLHTQMESNYDMFPFLLSSLALNPRRRSQETPSAGFRVGIRDKWKRSTFVQRSR